MGGLLGNPAACRRHETDGVSPVESRSITPQGGEAVEVPLGPELFCDYRLWVACEADEDLPMLLHYIDEDHIIIGSDYGHLDQSFEDNVVKKMRSREDIPDKVAEKILCENARNFYPL